MKLKQSFTDQMSELNKQLGSDFAIISHIKGNTYTVIEVASELETIQAGAEFVTEDTYCNEVINQDHMVSYNKVGTVQAMVHHPIYTAMQLEAYIGEPLHQNGFVIGTLNFSGFDPKEPAFSVDDIMAVKKLARLIEENIAT